MKLSPILLLAITGCILIGNSSFSCIGLKKLSVDSIYNIKPDHYGTAPRIDIEDLKTDSLLVQLADRKYLFTKQRLKNNLLLVFDKEEKMYTIEKFNIISADRDSIKTAFIYHSYNSKHKVLSAKEFTQNGFMIPVAMIDSFTSYR